MEINDAFRRVVVGHLRLLALFVVLPAVLVAALATTGHKRYVASARIQASSTTIGSDTEADSVLNRVKGIATSPAIVGQALRAANIRGVSAATAAGEVKVSRLGSSAVMDISVTDPDPRIAGTLASALATAVVNFIGQGSDQPQHLIDQLTAKQTELYAQRQQVVAALDKPGAPNSPGLSARLATIDQELADVASTLLQLQVTVASDSSARLVSPANSATLVRANTTTRTLLVVLAGLVAGLLVSSILEVVRPRVADARAFARDLGVPLLGWLSPETKLASWFLRRLSILSRRRPAQAIDHEGPGPTVTSRQTVVAVVQAAARAQADTLVLVGTRSAADLTALATSLTGRLAPAPQPDLSPNGNSGMSAAAAASGAVRTTTRTRVAAQVRRPPTETASLRVVPMAIVRAGSTGSCALLVVAGKLAPYAYVHEVEDLAAATGWPVIGVLGDPSRAERKRS